MLERLLYSSHISEGVTHADVARFVSASQLRNRRLDITGALLRCDDRFVQVVEGRTAAVADLMARIRADSRHHTLRELNHEVITTRLFDGWDMGYVEPVSAREELLKFEAGQMSTEAFLHMLRQLVEDERLSPQPKRFMP